jgi:beta-lactamase regulating signal transducer with metallopeptidase domain
MTLLLSIVIDVTVVCLIALLALALLRRHSAALRHAVLIVAIVVTALVPLLEILLPPLPILAWQTDAPVASSSMAVTSGPVVTDVTATTVEVTQMPTLSWGALLLAVWAVGAVFILGKLWLGFAYLARLEARSSVREEGRWRALADEISRSLVLRRRITILHSPDPVLLVTYGIRRPRLLLPVDAETWSDEHVRMVLTHELVHVRRHDPATMVLVELVCALHWFNPLVWLCAARVRRESECACDDAVLRCGTDATRYATLLLNVARLTAARHRAWVTAPAIAHPSTLEGRIAAMLNRQRNRAPVTRLAKALVAIIAGAIAIPLAAAGIAPSTSPNPVAPVERGDVSLAPVQTVRVEPTLSNAALATVVADRQSPASVTSAGAVAGGTAMFEPIRQQSRERRTAAAPAIAPAAVAVAAVQASGNITGTAMDASGGVVPGVRVKLAEPTLGLEANTVTDPNGRFSFRDVSPGRYELALSLAGFATVTGVLALDPGTTVTRLVTMPLGTVEETINVSCSTQAAHVTPGVVARLGQWWARAVDVVVPVLSAQDAAPMRPVRVGGNVRAPSKLTDVRPVCPVTLVPATGATVKLVGRIGVDGLIHDVRRVEMVADVELPSALSDSALAAVRQWVFTPTLLNGQPADTNISIRISYRHM